jgi:hypothetical protein
VIAIQPALHFQPDPEGAKAFDSVLDLLANIFAERVLEGAKAEAAVDLEAARAGTLKPRPKKKAPARGAR